MFDIKKNSVDVGVLGTVKNIAVVLEMVKDLAAQSHSKLLNKTVYWYFGESITSLRSTQWDKHYIYKLFYILYVEKRL